MPTENEFKFVLLNTPETYSTISSLSKQIINIEQGYLIYSKGTTARIRKQDNKFIFAFKNKTNNRTIELEQKISKRDGNDLWQQCIGKITKKRFIIQSWEIDFFFDQNHQYFVMAEIELPENSLPPKILPPFITDNLLHVVQQNDCQFSNKKLGDVTYVKNLYQQLLLKKVG